MALPLEDEKTRLPPAPEHCWPYGQRMVVQVTLHCPLRCGHCVVNAAPHRKEDLARETASLLHSQLRQCADLKALSLTGGEPFTRLTRLDEFSELSRDRGIRLYVMTSAFWAHTPRHAVGVLERLSGITHLNISTGAYHIRQVPLNSVRNAALAALDRGMAVTFRIVPDGDPSLLDRIKSLFDDEALKTIEFMPLPVQARGRAADLPVQGRAENVTLPDLPARSCGGISAPFVLCDGTVTACNGFETPDRQHPLTLGNIRHRSLAQIVSDADRSAFIHALRLWGPRGLLDLVEDQDGLSGMRKRYAVHDVCALCFDLCAKPALVDAVLARLDTPELQREIALGRALRYGERSMLGVTRPLPSS
jgi:pyruvate-formate lyase-activating enzyme